MFPGFAVGPREIRPVPQRVPSGCPNPGAGAAARAQRVPADAGWQAATPAPIQRAPCGVRARFKPTASIEPRT